MYFIKGWWQFFTYTPVLSEFNDTPEFRVTAFVSEARGLDMYKGELPVRSSQLYQMGTSEYFWQLRRCTEQGLGMSMWWKYTLVMLDRMGNILNSPLKHSI